MTPYTFFDLIRVYCCMVGGSISSYGRTWFHNCAVGGVRHSAHPYWMAGDVRTWDHLSAEEKKRVRDYLGDQHFEFPTPPVAERGAIAERLGLKLIDEGDHDHLQPLDWRAG